MSNARIEAILFDLDGTLLDSIPLILASFRHTLKTHGHPVPVETRLISGIGKPLWEQLRGLIGADDDADVDHLLATYTDYVVAHHDAMVSLYPGVQEMLETLVASGVPLALVTSKRRQGVERGLRHVDLEDCFAAIVAGDELDRAKPHPDPVLRALELLGVAPEAAIFVGDSPHDMASGRAAGVHTVAVTWGPFAPEALARHAPDEWLHDPEDLLQLVGLA